MQRAPRAGACAAEFEQRAGARDARSSSGRRSAGRSSSASAAPTPIKTRELAQSFAPGARQEPEHAQHQLRLERALARSIRVEVDQDRARALGISSQQLSQTTSTRCCRAPPITQLRDDIYLIDIVARAVREERAKLETLRNLRIATPGGRNVPLAQIATLSYALEPPLIWRRQRLPTVTVQADVGAGRRGDDRRQAARRRASRRSAPSCRPAMTSVVGGTVEDSAKAQASIFVVFPLMLFLMIDHPDGAADELPAPVPGAADRAAGADRRRRRAAALAARRWASSPSSASSR